MPVPGALPSPSDHHLRLIATGLVLAFLVSLAFVDTPPTRAANWSQQIAATRASQLYYESVMRSADHQIRSVKRATRQTQRKLRSGKRNLVGIKARRARLGARYRDTLKRFKSSKRELAQDSEVAPPSDLAGAILVLSSLEARPPAAVVSDTGSPSDGPDPLADITLPPMLSESRVSAEDVQQLRHQTKRHKRSFKKAARKTRRVARNVRARARSLSSLRRQRGYAIARREGAEAVLGGQILAMSRLAQRRASKKTKVRPGRSGFSWPARGRLSQSYGRAHDGLDIAGYRSSSIRAAAVGVVSYVGWNPWDQEGRAFMVVVAHPGGYETLYAHMLPTRRVKVGQLVRRGEVIGYMGNTGRSTGVHLHFEMRRGRTTLNPLGFL